jgi:hypothetical protein
MTPRTPFGSALASVATLGLLSLTLLGGNEAFAQSGPTAQPPYKISVFARSANGYTQPDSIVQWQDTILVGFQNGVAKDGTDGKSSTIVQYSLRGDVLRTFSVPGHNDGLRIVGRSALWSVQNEDANPNLVVIDLETGRQTQYSFPPTPHGGGYDDMVVVDDQVYITASNPNVNSAGVNVFPALVRARLAGSMVMLDTILLGNATATDISTGTAVTLNLTDPDSLTVDPRGNIVLDDQQDAVLVFIRNPGTDHQKVGMINITSSAGPTTLDDTAFAPSPPSYILVSDVMGNAVYRIDDPSFGFEPDTAYTGSDTIGIVAKLDLDSGVLAPIVTGLGSARGMIFVPMTDSDSSD